MTCWWLLWDLLLTELMMQRPRKKTEFSSSRVNQISKKEGMEWTIFPIRDWRQMVLGSCDWGLFTSTLQNYLKEIGHILG